ncbi:MAG TPA: hypothetical protein VHS33_04200 [Sphingomicrobium sp.]|nr:hypothetical protein [Sphingomicrobium sp.]
MSKKIKWKSSPKGKDYEGVRHFLTLLCSKTDADKLIERLDKAEPIEHDGKDILRAAGLPALSSEDPHVNRDLKDIQKGKALAPVLLIRGDLKKAHSLVIADGYHRVCASYIVDESSPVSCRLVEL